ncbi:MAG TPA: hypothetical protein VFC00_12080 [Micromonosporaceae bacterium]|nr:hypothetical protein [Micromonosporaceae bacterium]
MDPAGLDSLIRALAGLVVAGVIGRVLGELADTTHATRRTLPPRSSAA